VSWLCSTFSWSFEALNDDVNHLFHHIKRVSKSDVKIKRNFDFNISAKVDFPKLTVAMSSFFLKSLRIGLKFSNENVKRYLLSMIGSFMAIEDVELLCHLYKEFNYKDPFSHSSIKIVEKTVLQESQSTKEDLNTNGGSFGDEIQHKKCVDCEFHYLRSAKQDNKFAQKTNNTLRSNYRREAMIMHFVCSIIYLSFYTISFATSLAPSFSAILFSIAMLTATFLAWEFKSLICHLFLPIAILTIENTAILRLDKKYFNQEVFKLIERDNQSYSNLYFFSFCINVLFSWTFLTTFDIRSCDT
jgi:hypothetical protein